MVALLIIDITKINAIDSPFFDGVARIRFCVGLYVFSKCIFAMFLVVDVLFKSNHSWRIIL